MIAVELDEARAAVPFLTLVLAILLALLVLDLLTGWWRRSQGVARRRKREHDRQLVDDCLRRHADLNERIRRP